MTDLKTDLRPGAFFDRDGVINLDHGYIGDADRFELVEGASRALILCREAGYRVFVVTNQAGVAQGFFEEQAVTALHAHMRQLLAAQGAVIDDIRYCPHHPEAKSAHYRKVCDWRKPAPGMILDIARNWPIDLARSFLVGDKASDREAATAAGMRGFLYETGPLDLFVETILSDMREPGSPAGPVLAPPGSLCNP
jgi:D-glycero-D-manno-heptose 1,7-bisphosphate phosphatase